MTKTSSVVVILKRADLSRQTTKHSETGFLMTCPNDISGRLKALPNKNIIIS